MSETEAAAMGQADGRVNVERWGWYSIGINVVLTRGSLGGKRPVYVLREAGVKLATTDASTVEDALEQVRGGKEESP